MKYKSKSFPTYVMIIIIIMLSHEMTAVSYTHLDVYKRQGKGRGTTRSGIAFNAVGSTKDRCFMCVRNVPCLFRV